MVHIKTVDKIASKWAEVTPQRAKDYANGIASPRRSWSTATKAAESAYEDGIRASIAGKRFGKGVTKAGDEKWSRKATVNGTRNWGPGVQEAQGDFAAGFAPYQGAIAAATLPPRYARRDPRNLARVKAIFDALVAKKESLLGK